MRTSTRRDIVFVGGGWGAAGAESQSRTQVQDSGCRVLRFGVEGLAFGAWGYLPPTIHRLAAALPLELPGNRPTPGAGVSGSRVQGSGFRVQGPGFGVQGPGSRVQDPGSRVQGPEFRLQGYTISHMKTPKQKNDTAGQTKTVEGSFRRSFCRILSIFPLPHLWQPPYHTTVLSTVGPRIIHSRVCFCQTRGGTCGTGGMTRGTCISRNHHRSPMCGGTQLHKNHEPRTKSNHIKKGRPHLASPIP